MNDPVNNPSHYISHPSGVQCIQITQHMGFNLGNALKYIWRCDLKKDAIEDLRKAIYYLNTEIEKRLKAPVKEAYLTDEKERLTKKDAYIQELESKINRIIND